MIEAGVFRAAIIEVPEEVKVIGSMQYGLNTSFMYELAAIFDRNIFEASGFHVWRL